jgi:alkylated DNA repair dioxygenase AlkB
MNSLFPQYDLLPPGFTYIPGFLSKEEEQALILGIREMELRPMIFQGFEAKRETAGFGWNYSFDTRSLSKGRDIPPLFYPLIEKVAAVAGIASGKLEQMLVTGYPPGAVINWHRDAPPFGLVAGISLLSECTFRFRPHDKTLQHRKAIRSLTVHPRSLYIIDGSARTDWQHSIQPVKHTRYSITLRTLK